MRTFWVSLALIAVSALSVQGQATARVHGTVQDESGAAVPGASVKAIQMDTGVSRAIETEADGSFVLTNLPIGPYSLEVTKVGFATATQAGIVLQVNGDPAIPVALKVGTVSDRVNVQANASQVETSSVGVGNVIENQRVLDLPLNGRQPTDLITLSGAAVQMAGSAIYGMRTGVKISVAGGDSFGVQYNLDGAQHVNFLDGTGLLLPFPDALQEFKVSTSTQDAASGGRSGAQVNAVTKSGTNTFHGDVFEFLRNYKANARDFFQIGQDGLKRNQFGGVLGGPIKKDKLFFFMGYQGTTVRQTPIATTENVPTASMLQGDFTAFASVACQGKVVSLGAPFINGGTDASGRTIWTLPLSSISPAARAISQRLPTSIDQCGTVHTGTPLSENDHEVSGRADYQISDKQTLFMRYMLVKQLIKTPYTISPNDVLAAGPPGADDQFNSVSIGDTYLLSSSMVNSFRLSLNRVSAIKPGPNVFGPKDVGIGCAGVIGCSNPSYYTYQPNYLTVSAASGGFTLGSGNFNENSSAYTTSFGANNDFSVVHGPHQFAFGGFFTRSIEYWVSNAYSGGSFSIGSTSGLTLGDFLLGRVSSFRQSNPSPVNLSQNFMGLYAQDTWKLAPKLTLTYGINWSPFFGVSFQQGDVYNFSLADFYAGKRSTVVANAPPGFTYPGDPGFPGRSGLNSQWTNFDPRVGLAFDPFGDGKTAIRIGGGIAHSFIEQDLYANTASTLPFRLTVSQTPGTKNGFLDNPYPTGTPFPYNYNPANPVYPGASTAACLVSLTGCLPTFLPVPPNLKTSAQYSWNLGIQRQVTQNLFVSATYIGTHIIHLWNAVELNPGVYIPGGVNTAATLNARRELNLTNPNTTQPLGFITQFDDGGTQGYNGLLLNSAWRGRGGMSLNGNYTWSHCIGLLPLTILNPGNNYIHDGYGQNVGPANRNLDVGNCNQDRRHIANITLVYQTPKFAQRAARIAGSGWVLSSSFQVRSGGSVYAVTGNTTDPVTGFGGNSPGTQRLNQILPDVAAPNRGSSCAVAQICVQWLNPKAFAVPAVGTFGNLGFNSIAGPGFWQWDAALSREFKVTEASRIELRFEGYNLTNSLRLGLPNVVGYNGQSTSALTFSSPTFGGITQDATPPAGVGLTGGSSTNAPARVMQFALKYVF